MLSHGRAGIEPGRWAYATLPKPLDLEASDFTTAGPWPLFWSLEVRAASMFAEAGPSRFSLQRDERRQRLAPGRGAKWSGVGIDPLFNDLAVEQAKLVDA